MFMRMVYDEKLAQAAYLIGCPESGEAIVFDPQRDVDRYIELAEANDMKLVAAAETHIHADFLSGARELAERTGARVYLSGEGGPDWSYKWLDQKTGGGSYDHVLLRDGDEFKAGGVGFRAVHTPGHTPEHLAFVVTDHGSGATEPIGLVSGDFMFVGDLGRPDLLETAAGYQGVMEEAARQLFGTLRAIEGLPDFVQVWPGHGAGSACGKSLGAVPTTTVGYERRFSPALRAASDQRSFVDFILAGQPEPPLYFASMKRDNRDGPVVLGGPLDPPKVDASMLRALDPQAFTIVDTRPWANFRDGHLPCSLSFPLLDSFTTDIGSFVLDTDDIYLIINEAEREEALRDLIRIGLDRVKGWCEASEIDALDGLDTIDEIGPREAEALLGEVPVLDVRRAAEHAAGHIPGAPNISHTRLAARMGEVPEGERLIVVCRTGKRSARAASYLKRAGRQPINLAGGNVAWTEAGLRVGTA
ncbi:MAG: MBL fold metallo-hydrolase [Planctomycetota bacterium]